LESDALADFKLDFEGDAGNKGSLTGLGIEE